MYKIEIAKESRRKKEMKKKFVVALVAAMSLTVAGTGTVFAMNNFHIHGENCEWVVDKEAYDEVVKHPEEGHYEKVEVSPEEGHFEDVVITPGWTENKWVVDKEAWDEVIHHDEVTEQKWVVDKPAWTEEVVRMANFCNTCGFEIHSMDEWIAHSEASNGQCMGYHSEQVTEKIEHPEEGHYETVTTPAWDETVHHEEEGHYETIEHPAVTEKQWVVDKEAVYEDKWIVDKEAWEETIHHKEEGHWVCNGEPQEPEQKPEQPENPDQKPEQPENPDVETPEVPEQKPEVPTTPEENKENVQTQAAETKKEGTSPKTGDTTSALPVAGAGLASLGVVLATILKKRK